MRTLLVFSPVSLTSRGPRPRPQSVPVEIPLVRGLLRGERRRRLQVHHPAAARGSVQVKRELVKMGGEKTLIDILYCCTAGFYT